MKLIEERDNKFVIEITGTELSVISEVLRAAEANWGNLDILMTGDEDFNALLKDVRSLVMREVDVSQFEVNHNGDEE